MLGRRGVRDRGGMLCRGGMCGRGGMGGGEHVCWWHAWQGGMHGRGVHARLGMHRRYYEIRSMSGRYASYWNAFLFMTNFYRAGGAWPPRPPPGSATATAPIAVNSSGFGCNRMWMDRRLLTLSNSAHA